MAKYNNLDYEFDEVEPAAGNTNAVAVEADNSITEEIELDLPNKLQVCKDKIHSIAILLTGSFEDAEEVVQEVFEEISFNLTNHNHTDYNSETMDALIHRLTYDASLKKLLFQVDGHAAELEDTGSQILKAQKYLC